jgi:carboxypeptidase D
MYAGTIPLDRPSSNTSVPANATAGANATGTAAAEEDALFFIFKPKDGEPVDELTIWLNGGPGCSSMEGFFQEVGPINWLAGTFAPVPNPYAWSNLTNMLFVDQPVGTGYSPGTPKATSQADIAADFLDFLQHFQELFGISNYKIYVTGESYAGRYVPYIANAMLDANNTQHFDMSGILIYDPVIGHYNYMNQLAAYPYIEAYNNVWNFNTSFLAELGKMHQECGFADLYNKHLTFPPAGNLPPLTWNRSDPTNQTCDVFNSGLIVQLGINPCFNPYEIVSLSSRF